jgi:hypothetical protein
MATGQIEVQKNMDESYYYELSEKSGLARTQIASILALAHGPFLMHLHPHDCIYVLGAQAGLYAAIGFPRKEAFILRELLAVITDMVVCGRDERKMLASSRGPSIVVNDTSDDSESQMTAVSPVAETQALGIREVEDRQGNESVLRLVNHVCRIYGIDLASLEGKEGESSQHKVSVKDPLFDAQQQHGWPELQVGVVREAVAIAEALPGGCNYDLPI